MTRRAKLQEQYEDALFALLMDDFTQKVGEQALAELEQAKSDSVCTVSETLDHRCRKAIAAHFAKQRRRVARHTAGRILSRIAIVVAVCSVLFITAFALSEDVRVNTVNLVLTVTKHYTEFSVEQSGSDTATSDSDQDGSQEYFEHIKIGYLPEGYHYWNGEYNSWVTFMNDDSLSGSSWFCINVYDDIENFRVDTENAQRVEKININKNEAVYIARADGMQIILVDEVRHVRIELTAGEGTSKETAIEILKGLEFFGFTPTGCYFGELNINWLPQGFQYMFGEYGGAVFNNEDGQIIRIILADTSGILQVDTEDAESVENITVNGNEGLCILKDNNVHLVVTDLTHNRFISLMTFDGISKETALKILENLEFVDTDEPGSPMRYISPFANVGEYFENILVQDHYEYQDGEYNQWAKFENDDGSWFTLSVSQGNSTSEDTEGAENIENIMIQEKEVLCVRKNRQLYVTITDTSGKIALDFVTSPDFSVEEAVLILNNIEFVDAEANQGLGAPGTGVYANAGKYFEDLSIGWMPEGFTVSDSAYDLSVTFSDSQQNWLRIVVDSVDLYSTIRVDTEDAESVEEIEINGASGLCIVKDGQASIELVDLEHEIYLSLDASEGFPVETLKKVAESISYSS